MGSKQTLIDLTLCDIIEGTIKSRDQNIHHCEQSSNESQKLNQELKNNVVSKTTSSSKNIHLPTQFIRKNPLRYFVSF